MDRVIPNDVIDLIYKESHQDNMKRLNAEYHAFYVAAEFGNQVLYVRARNCNFYLGYRELRGNFQMYTNICAYKNNNLFYVGNLPKRYIYSSGHFGLNG